MVTTIWTDPTTDRIVYFDNGLRRPPRVVVLLTSSGYSSHAISTLTVHHFEGVLPDAMLPTVSWLYRLVDGQIRLEPEMA